jgi:phosphoglycerate dehydrogenase-like enzyme
MIRAGTLPEAWFPHEKVSELLARADAVVMCAPLTRDTERMIGAAELGAMKRSAYFVNVGRGATVDEKALGLAIPQSLMLRADEVIQ